MTTAAHELRREPVQIGGAPFKLPLRSCCDAEKEGVVTAEHTHDRGAAGGCATRGAGGGPQRSPARVHVGKGRVDLLKQATGLLSPKSQNLPLASLP